MSEVKVSEKGIEYAVPGVLKRKQRVFSQALLMKYLIAMREFLIFLLRLDGINSPLRLLKRLILRVSSLWTMKS